jgi:rhodanese-related sulfurtransferase
MKTWLEKIASLWPNQPPPITETSSLKEIAVHYPHVFSFLERTYGLKVSSVNRQSTLKEFCEEHRLPPAQILFMEIQLDERISKVKKIGAKEAKALLSSNNTVRLLDTREEWELKLAQIPGGRALTPQLLDEILTQWSQEQPLLVYCHFGVRSLDAATFFVDRGFKEVYHLEGGIDGWSLEIDSNIPRYSGGYC